MTSYTHLAKYYDEIMDAAIYADMTAFISERVSAQSHPRLLDLACGTAEVALALNAHGFNVTASDLSEQMLAIARHKQLARQVEFPLVQADMCALPFADGQFDIVTCCLDALCYLANEQNVQDALREIARVISPSGVLIFDVHSVWQMTVGYEQFSYHEQTADFSLLWDSTADATHLQVTHALTIFERLPDGNYVRHDEIHEERTYPLLAWMQWLHDLGFVVTVTDGWCDEPVDEKSPRWVFYCEKQ